jgi:carbon monoxide dehydrogenase subunit G
MRVDKEETLQAPVMKVWEELWNVQKLIGFIPGVQAVETIEDGKHYKAQVRDKVGPFQVSFHLNIVVETAELGSFLRARVSGAERRLASTLQQVIEIRLSEPSPGSTLVNVGLDISILGKLGSLGDGLIRTRANDAISTFMANLKKDIEGAEIAVAP